jgi:DNA-binding MarR family transcriptional regulator
MAATSPAVWAGRGMTLLQLTALHFISALARSATSAMVARLNRAGLVCSIPDPQNRRRVQLALTAEAEPIISDIDPDTSRRVH